MRPLVCSMLLALTLGACRATPPAAPEPAPAATPATSGPTVTKDTFGTIKLPNQPAQEIERFTLKNARGVEVQAITYGGIITSIKAPDRNGAIADIVLGFDSIDGYAKDHPYFGAIVGRYGNRIARGRFELEGRTFRLATNEGPNHLHGGKRGFDKQVWKGEQLPDKNGVRLSRISPDGEEGYPGNLELQVSYELTDGNQLIVEYRAVTDKATPLNVTQHSYFNLAGEGAGDILGHSLVLNADRYTPVNGTLIPTGDIASVEGTPFDFRKPTPIGARINQPHPQLKSGKGYDHNWVLNRSGDVLQIAAVVTEPASGRTLEITTTEPGIQFYAGNSLDGTLIGKGGHVYTHRSGFCLETQHFPDSPNQPAFPSTIVRPGQPFKSTTVFTVGVSR